MENSKKDLFEILKTRTSNVALFFNAVEFAERDLGEIKNLAVKRGSGELVDVRTLVEKVIAAKKHLDEALVFCVESQLEKNK